ncbi:hypothetical protein [Phenylobacterium sp.]|uniref:hypothetical protein n=1 Tax=Phenylobacterium sp. TaxID=1871053 RepID=UPI002F95AE2F
MLRVTYSPDGDGTGELRAFVDAQGVAGSGAAYFDETSLAAFCERLGDYPLQPDDLPSLAGGYWDPTGERLEATHLSIAVFPHDGLGTLRLEATMADSASPHPLEAKTWFLVGYNQLSNFQRQLRGLLAGAVAEAVLVPGPD